MKISLCLPVAIRKHDTQRADMLVQCLESILAQTHQDYEVILKDAFPAESVKLHANVRECMEKFGPKLNYVACPDSGIFDGLNQALWWATGDILHFICVCINMVKYDYWWSILDWYINNLIHNSNLWYG